MIASFGCVGSWGSRDGGGGWVGFSLVMLASAAAFRMNCATVRPVGSAFGCDFKEVSLFVLGGGKRGCGLMGMRMDDGLTD